MLREATTKPKGTNQHTEDSDNVTILPERGNSLSYTLRRLKSRLSSGELRLTAENRKAKAKELIDSGMSQRQAAVELGVEKTTIQRDLELKAPPRKKPTPLETAMRIWRKMSAVEREQFLEWAARE